MKIGRNLVDLAQEIARQAETKKDYIVRTDVIQPAVEDDKLTLRIGNKGHFAVGDIAHDQIGEHTGIPRKYYDRMRAENPILLATNIDAWFQKYPAPRMTRMLDGRCRAFLSDKFNRLDNIDFAEAMLPTVQERGLKIMSCEITEKRLYIKAVDEKLFRDVPVGFKMGDGTHKIFDTCAPVICLGNSEVGFGRLFVETGVYTQACTNMAMFAKGGMRRSHVGARHKLVEELGCEELDEIMTDATRRKTMEALWLQVRDVIASAFDQKVFAKRCEQLAEAAGAKIEGKVEKVVEMAATRWGLNDGERESVLKHLITGGNLSQYGLHAAITRTAEDVADYDRATELEFLGGKVIELPRHAWQEVSEARPVKAKELAEAA